MKGFIKKYWKPLCIFFFIGIIVIPLAIHIAFKTSAIHSFMVAEWTSDGFLGFYGALMGALSTVYVFALTIRYNRDIERENRKFNTKPYLYSEYYPIYELAKKRENESLLYIIVGNQVSSSFEIPYEYEKDYEEKSDSTEAVFRNLRLSRERHMLHYALSNAGAGSSVNTDFRINDEIVMPPFALPINAKLVMVIILKSEILVNNEKMIDITITYDDVVSIGHYEQCERIRFFRDKDDDTLSTNQMPEWLLCKPKDI